jgi:hypothetical protein
MPALHGTDFVPGGSGLAGVEMSLVGALGRERFLHDALETVVDEHDEVVIDTPPNLGLLIVNTLVCADRVVAPVSAEDEVAPPWDPRAARHDHQARHVTRLRASELDPTDHAVGARPR